MTYMRRAKKELVLLLHEPEEARSFVMERAKGRGIFILMTGERINLRTMSDSDAVRVALDILNYVIIPDAQKEANLKYYTH